MTATQVKRRRSDIFSHSLFTREDGSSLTHPRPSLSLSVGRSGGQPVFLLGDSLRAKFARGGQDNRQMTPKKILQLLPRLSRQMVRRLGLLFVWLGRGAGDSCHKLTKLTKIAMTPNDYMRDIMSCRYSSHLLILEMRILVGVVVVGAHFSSAAVRPIAVRKQLLSRRRRQWEARSPLPAPLRARPLSKDSNLDRAIARRSEGPFVPRRRGAARLCVCLHLGGCRLRS